VNEVRREFSKGELRGQSFVILIDIKEEKIVWGWTVTLQIV
jgi:hypothetical protein